MSTYFFRILQSSERAGIRTPDNLIKSQVLYHLSYTPETGVAGFEPAVQESESWALPLGDTPLIMSQLLYYIISRYSCQLIFFGSYNPVSVRGFEPRTT